MMDVSWDTNRLRGPDNQDWRVPTNELEKRQDLVSKQLDFEGIESILIDDPVELYWLTGSRQNSYFIMGSKNSDIENTLFVRRSFDRAVFECGEDNSPHEIRMQPRMAEISNELIKMGCNKIPGMLEGKIPHSRFLFLKSKLSEIGGYSRDCTNILFSLREKKSQWEIDMMKESGRINKKMFDVIHENGGVGKTEIELAGIADKVSRTEGFGGRIRMRNWPMDCDRVVITSGESGAVPSYFDSGVAGLGTSPISSLGAGFAKIKSNEPVLVDIVHVHRGYVSDCTRIFHEGKLSDFWIESLNDMNELSDRIVSELGKGFNCSKIWKNVTEKISELGYSNNLMGIKPNQAKFIGHSVGLELDETPVIAQGFDRPLENFGVMAVEPKVVYSDGVVGIEDTWVRGNQGMECITAGDSLPPLMEW